jgi:drug/metabolite transporter (DMT)-like permease
VNPTPGASDALPVTPPEPATPPPSTAPKAAPRWGALAAVVVTVLAWASAFIVLRVSAPAFGPGALTELRLVVGVVALGAGLLVGRRWVAPTGREWLLLTVCGVAWFGVYNVALSWAEKTVDAGTTAMLVNIGPILIALFAGLLLGEGFPRWLVIGALVAFSGAVLVGAATANTDDADLFGALLCVVAAVTYAIGVLAQKPVLRRLPALQVTFLACAIGAVCSLPFTPELLGDLATAPAPATLGVVYLGAVPTALAFSTWAYALARMDAGRLGVTTYLVPPITVGVSALLLDELPVPLALVGGAVCLVGVGLSRRR